MKNIFLTVDVECHDIKNINRWIIGNYKNQEYGLHKILELGKEYNIPINFFVDIPEANRYGQAYICEIIEKIKEFNQPIYLHIHPNYVSGDEERTFLWQYNKEEKKEIFTSAYEQYCHLVGKKEKLIFRMGRYGVDKEFYDILESEKIKVIDLSYGYGNVKMCKLLDDNLKKNNLMRYKGNILLPNTSYVGLDILGKKKYLGLDVAQTNSKELLDIINNTTSENIVITMHVWDLFKRYFFTNKIYPNMGNIKKLKLWIRTLDEKGHTFCKVEEINEQDVDNQKCMDTIYNPYKYGFINKIRFIWYNFFRFIKMARNSKKYFFIYLWCMALLLILLNTVIYLLL